MRVPRLALAVSASTPLKRCIQGDASSLPLSSSVIASPAHHGLLEIYSLTLNMARPYSPPHEALILHMQPNSFASYQV
jgi:hypothetical protein